MQYPTAETSELSDLPGLPSIRVEAFTSFPEEEAVRSTEWSSLENKLRGSLEREEVGETRDNGRDEAEG